MPPSESHERIREEHTDLRRRLAGLDELARRVGRDEHELAERLRRETESLLVWLGIHIDYEDRVLVPMLRAGNEHDRDHAEEILRHHQEQRRELRETIIELRREVQHPAELARRVLGIVTEVRADMEYEEAHYLGEG